MEWLEFNLLANQPGIRHGVFLRHGGFSSDSFGSLNMMYGLGDLEENVRKNRQSVLDILKLEKLVASHQVHGAKIEFIENPQRELECDGQMTNSQNWGLLSVHADCQTAIFFDPIHRAIANIHAGWRGQTLNIYQKTIAKMALTFGTRPQDLLVCISPSLGPENAEFKNYKSEFPEYFWKFQIKPMYFDLWSIADQQLRASGVLSHHIEIAKIDTYANAFDFYSYRREKNTGRHGTIVALT